jgi:sugar lactone lactonase YvrE
MIINRVFALAALAASALNAQTYTISTVAGAGPPPSSVPALGVTLPVSGGLAAGAAGDVYFSSGNAVLKVDAQGILTRLAGTGRYGTSGDGGPATRAQLAWPAGLAVDASGNVYIAENAGHRIRKLSRDGTLTTIAGTGTAGDSGDGGPASNAQLRSPIGIAVDPAGNLYIADTGNNRIRKVSVEGVMTTVAAGLHRAEGVAVDGSGNVYVTDYEAVAPPCEDCDETYAGRIVRIRPGGIVETIAGGGTDSNDNVPAVSALLETPRGIAVDAEGTLYVSDWMNNRVRRISPSGVISTAAGVNRSDGYCVYGGPGWAGHPLPWNCPVGVALDAAGTLYVAATGNHRIRKISAQGDIADVAGSGVAGTYWGDGGRAEDAALSYPMGLAIDGASNLYIADTGNSRVRKVSPDGIITTVAGNGTSGYSGDGGPATSAQLRGPAGLAVDPSGNLYIADFHDHRIRKVSPAGIITTVAGSGSSGHGLGPWGDGGPAVNAQLAGPFGVAVDAGGNLYIADWGHFSIRKVSPAGVISTAAGGRAGPLGDGGKATDAGVGWPTGVALDALGNLLIAASDRIRKVSSDGIISTVAVLPAFSVATDAASNLYSSEAYLSGFTPGAGRVRKIASGGVVTAIAGNGVPGYSGDGGPATSASLSVAATGIAIDAAGNVYVADTFNHAIRVLRVKNE